ETEIRGLADSIYFRVDWNWAQARPPAVSMGWHPEGGFIPTDWIGYNEAMILYVLALGSPTHALDATAWSKWVSGYQWGMFRGQSDGMDRLLEPDVGAHGLGWPGQHDADAQGKHAPVPYLLGARGLAVRVQ